MKETDAYQKMQELINTYSGNIAVLEDEIDISLQVEYFKKSKSVKESLDKDEALARRELLFESQLTISEKRNLLCELASINNVESFRALEKYMKSPDEPLRDWSVLAYQESKMVLESNLLDQAPLFISTGLGGRGQKLRYFIVVTSNGKENVTEIQQKIIRSEFEFAFNKVNGELEQVEAESFMVAITGLLPLQVDLKPFLTKVIEACNELGDFLNESFMVTNVKKLSFPELEKSISKYEAFERKKHEDNK